MHISIFSIIEMAGTMAFAISGIRLAALKRFDLFGAYVVGFVTAIGGGTIRDVMLGVTPFWMEEIIYLILTAISLVWVIVLDKYLLKLKNTLFIFDTIGLALFTIVGLEKSLDAGFPLWVAIIMGVITGSFGGIIRDILIGEVPLIFRRDIYALASMLGGIIFAIFTSCGFDETTNSLTAAASVIIMRVIAVKFHLQLPIIKGNPTPNPKVQNKNTTK